MPVDTDGLKQIFLALPEVREGVTHGTLSFYLGKTFFGRMQEDGSSFALKMDFGDRDMLIAVEPEIFFTTDHFRGYAYVLVRLPAIDADHLAPLVEKSWRQTAPKRILKAFDSAAG
ncbi:MmcQ/YjbR family DNA-binding protein [Kaistia sp. UC242_56]|uniref:MmcQ/YjbR family DNA-binding protein n=1 Tax=Kaistia sp. UC242_56 TaxID=3374625 RepID=UPI0037B93A3B